MQSFHLQNRPDRELTSEAEITQVLKDGKYAVISMCRDNEPHIVSLSYGFDLENTALYFHCAKVGMKIDFIQSNPSVCATVIHDGGYVNGHCEHHYKTAVFRGNMSIVTDLAEKKHGMAVLLKHLETDPDVVKRLMLKSDEAYSKMEILKLQIVQITAKAGK
jgi:uncharacterized protein